jgi:hypothetical protein
MFAIDDYVLVSPPIPVLGAPESAVLAIVVNRDINYDFYPNCQRVRFTINDVTLWIKETRLTKITKDTHPKLFI